MAKAVKSGPGTRQTFCLLTAMLFHHALCQTQFLCKEGSFPDANGQCKLCPFGTQQEVRDRCAPCRAGTFGVTKGVKGFSENCLECPPGTFNPTTGATECQPCPPGTDSAHDYTKCFRCGKGMRINIGSRKQGCTKCAPGSFSDTESNRLCKPCPKGTWSRAGAAACSICPKGTLLSKNKCTRCDVGTFNDREGATFCKICRPGTFSAKGATACTPCPSGTFSDTLAAFKCKQCPAGTSSLGIKPAACKDTIRGCTFSTFENADGECEACMPGERLDKAKKKCIPCAEDEISQGGVTTACKKCPADRTPTKGFALMDDSTCVCKMGTEDPTELQDGVARCRPCSPGSIGYPPFFQGTRRNGLPSARIETYPGPRPEPRCLSCVFGTVSVDRSRCMPCPPGFVIRDNKCEKCPRGTRSFQSFLSRWNDPVEPLQVIGPYQCLAKDTGCPVGSVLGTGRCNVEFCPKGTFLRKPFTFCSFCREECRSCKPGEFRAFRKECRPCPKRQRSPGGAITRCIKCPNNEVGVGNSCKCPPGTGRVGRRCITCPPGTFNDLEQFDLNASDEPTCSPCAPGTFSAEAGQRLCEECPENFITIGTGASRCVKCPRGSRIGRNLRGDPANACVPKDMYDKDPELLAALAGLQE